MVDEKKELAQTAKLFEYMAQLQKTIKITPAAIMRAKKEKGKQIDTSQSIPHSYNTKALRQLAATTVANVPVKLTPREVTNAKSAAGSASLVTLFAAVNDKKKANPSNVPPNKEEQ